MSEVVSMNPNAVRARKAAEMFRRMADRIELNQENNFCGAILCFPPGDGDPLEILILDSQQDVAAYWGQVHSRAAISMNTLDEAARIRKAGFGGIR